MRPTRHLLEYGRRRGRRFSRADFCIYGCLLLLAFVAAAIVIPKFTSRLTEDVGRRTQMDVSSLNFAIEVFKSDNGRYPTSSEGLAALSIAPPGCPNRIGPYVAKPIVADAWGPAFVYRMPG